MGYGQGSGGKLVCPCLMGQCQGSGGKYVFTWWAWVRVVEVSLSGDRLTTPRTTTLWTTTPLPITHQDNYSYPSRTITPVGQLPPRAISPVARKTTPKDDYPHRKVIWHNLNCTPLTDWE